MEKNDTKLKNRLISVLVGVITLLSGGIIFLVYDRSQDKKQISIQEVQIHEQQDLKDGLSTHLDHELEKYRLLNEKYERLNIQNEEILVMIEKLEAEKNNWKNRANLSSSQIAALKSQIQNLITESEIDRKKKDSEIRQLIAANEMLMDNNKHLLEVNDSLSNVSKEQELVNENIIKKAGKLHFENFAVLVHNNHGQPLTKEPYKEKHIESIVARFNLSKNDMADKGKRSFVMRIEKPDGGILYDASANGSTFLTDNKQQFYYTVAKDANFNNNYEEVVLKYNKQGEMSEGTYHIQIYMDGELTEKSSFVVK